VFARRPARAAASGARLGACRRALGEIRRMPVCWPASAEVAWRIARDVPVRHEQLIQSIGWLALRVGSSRSTMTGSIRRLERQLDDLVEQTQTLNGSCLRVYPVITAINLLACLPQLGFKNRKEICGVMLTRAVRVAKPDTSTAVDRT